MAQAAKPIPDQHRTLDERVDSLVAAHNGDLRGERWFCDKGEAIAAGWRAPYWGR